MNTGFCRVNFYLLPELETYFYFILKLNNIGVNEGDKVNNGLYINMSENTHKCYFVFNLFQNQN